MSSKKIEQAVYGLKELKELFSYCFESLHEASKSFIRENIVSLERLYEKIVSGKIYENFVDTIGNHYKSIKAFYLEKIPIMYQDIIGYNRFIAFVNLKDSTLKTVQDWLADKRTKSPDTNCFEKLMRLGRKSSKNINSQKLRQKCINEAFYSQDVSVRAFDALLVEKKVFKSSTPVEKTISLSEALELVLQSAKKLDLKKMSAEKLIETKENILALKKFLESKEISKLVA